MLKRLRLHNVNALMRTRPMRRLGFPLESRCSGSLEVALTRTCASVDRLVCDGWTIAAAPLGFEQGASSAGSIKQVTTTGRHVGNPWSCSGRTPERRSTSRRRSFQRAHSVACRGPTLAPGTLDKIASGEALQVHSSDVSPYYWTTLGSRLDGHGQAPEHSSRRHGFGFHERA